MSARHSSVIPSFRFSLSLSLSLSLYWEHIYIYIYIYKRSFHERTQLRYRLRVYSISALKFSNVPLLLRGDTTSRSGNGLLHVKRIWMKFCLRRKTSLTLWLIDKDNKNSLYNSPIKNILTYSYCQKVFVLYDMFYTCHTHKYTHIKQYFSSFWYFTFIKNVYYNISIIQSCKVYISSIQLLSVCPMNTNIRIKK